ncbi:leucyl aminopeptidase [Clavulina sp. PMI_390]|nr:leucyl aminopeptidase [Clavulina sp. PMI_390]
MAAKPIDYRLPTNTRPTHYDLTIETDLEELKFYGYAIIDIDILADTDSITFNAAEIDFTDATITDSSGQVHAQVSRTDDTKQERVQLKFSKMFEKGSKVQLSVGWKAELTNSMKGYYRSSFEQDGKKTYYAVTQFQYPPLDPSHRAFPAWDEPLLKSRYTITLISRSETTSLSNMPAANKLPYSASGEGLPAGAKMLVSLYPHADPGKAANEWQVTTFEKSPPMSSYLVAFANGNFKYVEDSFNSPLSGKTRKLRVYTTPDLIHQAQYALDVKKKILPIYEKLFDVEYPLPKLDTLVVADFDLGAMENWGLITGRTTAFLYDPKKSSLSARKRVAELEIHECAHMWFGDITTMSWWDALWLNEGFATLMGKVIIMNRFSPEWKPHSEFIIASLERALELDAKRSSHPIMVDLPDANDINQIFDALSYDKSASVLRMLSEYVGEEKFLKGVSIYLKNHLYANSEPVDLWNGISQSTGLDIAKMMDNWVYKIGFPVVTVKEEENGKVTVRQDRFLSSGDPKPEENETLWYIPLSVLSADASGKLAIDRSVVLQDRESTISIDTSKPWKLNAGTSGIFRVAYEPERLKQLGIWASQKDSPFALEDRMGLVSDATILAQAGVGKTSAALDLIASLHKEEENLVWSAMAASLVNIKGLLWEQPAELLQSWNEWINYLYLPIVEKLGYDYHPEDSADVSELRTRAITNCARAQESTVVKELVTRFNKFVETKDDSWVPPDLQTIIYSMAIEHGGQKEFDTIKQIWKNPATPSAKSAAGYALTQIKTEDLAKQVFDLLTNEVQLQDFHPTVNGLSANTFTRRKMAQYFYDNYDSVYMLRLIMSYRLQILKRYEGTFSFTYIVEYTFRNFTTEKDATKIAAFFEGKDNSKYNLALSQALENIKANSKWLNRSQGDIEAWLTKFSKEKGSKL